MQDLGLPGRYEWRYRIDADRLDAGRLETLVPDLRRLDTEFGTNRPGFGLVVFRSGLLESIDRYLTQRAASEAVLSVAAIGPLAVAAGALGLVAVVIIRRRRASLALSRGRGASTGQLLAAQLWEGLLHHGPGRDRRAARGTDRRAGALGPGVVGRRGARRDRRDRVAPGRHLAPRPASPP